MKTCYLFSAIDKEIVYNDDKLTNRDIDETVIRTKALIINSKNEIMLGYSNKTYQFPGGHLENGETLNKCLIREIKEETGIELEGIEYNPFIRITYYSKNYRNTGKNRKNEIYYFIINTDKNFNINKQKLDKGEIEGNYVIKSVPLDNIENILIDSIEDNPINKIIVKEMLSVIAHYKKMVKN